MSETFNIWIKHIIRSRRTWTVLLIFMIGASTASLIILKGLTDAFTSQQEKYSDYNLGFIIMHGKEPHILYQGVFDDAIFFPFSENETKSLETMNGIESIYKVCIVKIPHKLGDNITPVGLIGLEIIASEVAAVPYANMVQGNFLDQTLKECALANLGLSRKLDVNVPLIIEIDGESTTLRVNGVYDSLLPTEIDPKESILVDISTFWELVNVNEEPHRYNALLVKTIDPNNGEKIAEQLRNLYAGDESIFIYYQYALAGRTIELLSSTSALYNLINISMTLSAALSIAIVCYFDTSRRKRELGLLMVIGWREENIVRFLGLNSVLVGFMGTILGLILSYVVRVYSSNIIIPAELMLITSVNIGSFSDYFIYALSVPLLFSLLGFIVTYLSYRRLSPLDMMSDQ